MENAMIRPADVVPSVVPGSCPSQSADAMVPSHDVGTPARARPSHSNDTDRQGVKEWNAPDPVLCGHCGRTASNGISCMGMCLADSGY